MEQIEEYIFYQIIKKILRIKKNINKALKNSNILVLFDLIDPEKIYQIEKHINNIEKQHSISRVINIDKDCITLLISEKYHKICGLTTYYNYYNHFKNRIVRYWKTDFHYYKLINSNKEVIGYFNKKINLETFAENNKILNYKIERIENNLSTDKNLLNILLRNGFCTEEDTFANMISALFVKNISKISTGNSLIKGIIKECNNCISLLKVKDAPDRDKDIERYTTIRDKFDSL